MNMTDYKKLVKKPKYNNTKVNGFDSRKEAQRATTLQLMQKGGLISDLQMQSKFELIPSQYGVKDGKRICIERSCMYVADFTYIKDGVYTVEDVKGKKTEVYRIKKKLMLHVHGIQILET